MYVNKVSLIVFCVLIFIIIFVSAILSKLLKGNFCCINRVANTTTTEEEINNMSIEEIYNMKV
jgi:hypothetical protein